MTDSLVSIINGKYRIRILADKKVIIDKLGKGPNNYKRWVVLLGKPSYPLRKKSNTRSDKSGDLK